MLVLSVVVDTESIDTVGAVISDPSLFTKRTEADAGITPRRSVCSTV